MKTVLCYGDSNTYGYDPETGLRYSPALRWPDALQALLGPEYRVIPEGLNGRTTAFGRKGLAWLNGLSTLDPIIRTHYPIDYLIFMLGTNDCCAELGLSAEEITTGMEKLIDRARAHLSEIQESEAEIIIIAPKAMDGKVLRGVFSYEMDEKSVRVSQELTALYKELAQRKGCGFTDIEDIIELSETDGEHFLPEGGKKLAGKLKEKFF